MKKLLLVLGLMPMLAFGQAVLPTVWNFSTPGISTPPTGWITGLGTNGNLTYSGAANSVGGDNTACRLDATGEFLTIWFGEKPGPVSYWIKGTGISPNPSFTGTFSIQESPDGSSWSNLRSFTTASPLSGTMTRYVDAPAATTRYIRFFYATKESGSNVSLDSVKVAEAPAPTLGVRMKQGSTTLLNGGTFVFGNSASKLFSIENFGTTTNLKTDSIVVTGANASDFSVGSFDSITPGLGNDTFSLYFNSGANGSRFASVKVYTNDTERNPYTINLYAIGGNYANEPNQVPSLAVSNVRTQTLTVSYGSAGSEGYLVLRKAGAPITETPADGVTYKRGDYIGGAQVLYVGTDTASIRPSYILANTSYYFKAFSFNGPTGFENYNTNSAPAGSATTLNGEPGNYYAGIDPMVNTFVTQLHNKVTVHDTVFYSNYISAMVNNYLFRDTTGGKKVVDCVYTGARYVYEDPFTWWTGQGNNPGTLTREHTFAQSWMPTNTGGNWPNGANGREYQEYNDLHHLFPAEQVTGNGKRSNYPFGVVTNATYVAPTGFGKLGTDGGGKTVYEPKNDQKGDVARALFYMLISYNGVSGINWRLPASQDVNVLLQWHQQDPPSALEIARHEHIFTYQKNRNPFIDHPEWANFINFSNMTYVPDPNAKILTLTSPVGGTNLIQGKRAVISWTSQNVDTVLVELRTSPTAAYSVVGKYPATANSVNPFITAEPSTSANIRISMASDSMVKAVSGAFNIVASRLTITRPTGGNLYLDSVYTIKWNRSFVDSVVIRYVYDNNGTPTSVSINGGVPARDSMVFTVPSALVKYNVLLIADEQASASKLSAYQAADTVVVNFVEYVGLNENTALNNLVKVFPVPSSGKVSVLLPADITDAQIEVLDIMGRKVLATNEEHFNIDTKGVYIVRVLTNKGIATKRVVIE